MSEPALKKCPKCGKRKLRRVFGAGLAIIFKGSGFYQTDYRSEGYKAAAKADEEKAKPPADKPAANGTGTTAGQGATAKEAKPKEKSSK
jgi:hypothetical protein